jgi:uncharacterized membrane protein
VEGRFCPKCGAPAEGGTSPQPPQTPAADSGLSVNVASALCYLLTFITGIVFLVLEPYNRDKTVRFHAFQAIFLGIAVIAVHFALMMVSIILGVVSSVLAVLFSMLHLVVSLGFFVIWLFMMWKAYNNERVVLPVIGPLAEKQA